MRLRIRPSSLALAAAFVFTFTALGARVGDPAPDFTGTDTHGQTHKLSDYRGKFVVLEWTNNGCPYTQKHYNSGNMQALQKEWTAKGVVWLMVNTGAPGKEGVYPAAKFNELAKAKGIAATAELLDGDGKVGRLYNAKTTPQMFIINPQGEVVYAGAIDSIKSAKQDDIPKATNYVKAALDEAMAGKPVTTPTTQSYGCSVKY